MKSAQWANDLLSLVFLNANVSLIGDATGLRGSATAGNLFISLHTAEPGPGGNQSTNEVAYLGYERQPVVRGVGFSVTGNSVTNVNDIVFPLGTGGPEVNATHFVVGTDATGPGKSVYSGEITSPAGGLPTGNARQPVISAGGMSLTEE